MSKVFLTIFCIDKRFDYLSAKFFESTNDNNYYLLTTAGSSLCLGYEKYPKNDCDCGMTNEDDMNLLKDSIVKNIKIASSLDNLEEVYLLNHQDCGAIKAYLNFTNYPKNVGDDNTSEIKINTELLLYAKEYILKNISKIQDVKLALIDINGTVAEYDLKYCSWKLKYRGPGNDPNGLWYGL